MDDQNHDPYDSMKCNTRLECVQRIQDGWGIPKLIIDLTLSEQGWNKAGLDFYIMEWHICSHATKLIKMH